IRKQDSAGEPLKQVRLVRIDVQVIHFDLGARPGETRFALEDVWIAILFGEHDRLVARLSHAGGENDLYSFGRLQSQATTQAEDRIEYRPDSVRQRTILHHRDRFCRASSATPATR